MTPTSTIDPSSLKEFALNQLGKKHCRMLILRQGDSISSADLPAFTKLILDDFDIERGGV